MYSFNVNLLKRIYIACGFKTVRQFIKDYPYCYTSYYKYIDRKDMGIFRLLNICEKYKLNPFAFFLHPERKIPQLHMDNTYHFIWEEQNYIMLPDGTIKLFMDIFDYVPYQRRRRLLRGGEKSTMKVSHFIRALNTYKLNPEDIIIPNS